MKGFTDKALLLLPEEETYDRMSTFEKYQFKLAVASMVEVFKSKGIDLYISMCHSVNFSDYALPCKQLGTAGDMDIWAFQQLGIQFKGVDFVDEEILIEALDQFPPARGLSNEERVAALTQREIYALKQYAKRHFKIIIDMEFGKVRPINFKSKKDDGTILFVVSPELIITKAFMAGMENNAVELMDYPQAYRNLKTWKV